MARAPDPNQPTGAAFAQAVGLLGEANRRSLGLRLQPFRLTPSLRARLSSVRSATQRLSQPFSSSSSRSRTASLTSSPPYFRRHRQNVSWLMPCSRIKSFTPRPTCASFRIPMICSAANRRFILSSLLENLHSTWSGFREARQREARKVRVEGEDRGAVSQGDRGEPRIGGEVASAAHASKQLRLRPQPWVFLLLPNDPDALRGCRAGAQSRRCKFFPS